MDADQLILSQRSGVAGAWENFSWGAAGNTGLRQSENQFARRVPLSWAGGAGRIASPFASAGMGAARGALSSFFPVAAWRETDPKLDAHRAAQRLAEIQKPGVKMSLMEKVGAFVPAPVKKYAKKGLRLLGRWAGPLITGYRLHSENKGLSFLGKVSKSTRIIGEEAMFGAGMGIGMVIGGAIGTAIAPGVGTAVGGVIGMVAGAVIGLGIGFVGSYAVNKVVDAAEAPFKVAAGGWRYLRDVGRSARKVELGGGISAGNRTQAAATMRQRALDQIYRSGINERSVLGRESMLNHLR